MHTLFMLISLFLLALPLHADEPSVTTLEDDGDRADGIDVVYTQCESHQFNFKGGVKTAEICVHREPSSRSRDILYFFHGMGESARNWIKNPRYGTVRKDQHN